MLILKVLNTENISFQNNRPKHFVFKFLNIYCCTTKYVYIMIMSFNTAFFLSFWTQTKQQCWNINQTLINHLISCNIFMFLKLRTTLEMNHLMAVTAT
jgi:hypothetical protein